jgi:hypothetical protein
MYIPRFHWQSCQVAFIEAHPYCENAGVLREQPVIIPFPVPQAMAFFIETHGGHDNQIDITRDNVGDR